MPREGHTSVTIADPILDKVKQEIEKANEQAGFKKYRSLAHYVETAITDYIIEGFREDAQDPQELIEQIADLIQQKEKPLEHFNLNADGVRVLDRNIDKTGRIIDVTFTPDKAHCTYCNSDHCDHVTFALDLPAVKKILEKKGWKITI